LLWLHTPHRFLQGLRVLAVGGALRDELLDQVSVAQLDGSRADVGGPRRG
jgi:hypothetical protein